MYFPSKLSVFCLDNRSSEKFMSSLSFFSLTASTIQSGLKKHCQPKYTWPEKCFPATWEDCPTDLGESFGRKKENTTESMDSISVISGGGANPS